MPIAITDEPVGASGPMSLIYAAVDELERRYGTADDGPHLTYDELGPPRGFFLVARLDGDLAGGVGLRPIGDPSVQLGEVKRLWVRPDLRQQGVAKALMDALVERARELHYRQLFLETGRAQPEAQALYPRIGWQPVDSFPLGTYTHPAASRFTLPLVGRRIR